MAITGSHVMLYSSDPKKDNKFFVEVLKFPNVSLGDGWLIFGLPPTELMVGTAAKEASDADKKTAEEKEGEKKESSDADGGALPSGSHQLLLMCDDIKKFVVDAKALGVECAKPKDEGWGIVSHFQLPGGSKLSIYEPRHEFPTYPKSIDIAVESTEAGKTSNGKHVLPADEDSNMMKKAKA